MCETGNPNGLYTSETFLTIPTNCDLPRDVRGATIYVDGQEVVCDSDTIEPANPAGCQPE